MRFHYLYFRWTACVEESCLAIAVLAQCYSRKDASPKSELVHEQTSVRFLGSVLFYRPHPKDEEGNIFSLSTLAEGGYPHLADGGIPLSFLIGYPILPVGVCPILPDGVVPHPSISQIWGTPCQEGSPIWPMGDTLSG